MEWSFTMSRVSRILVALVLTFIPFATSGCVPSCSPSGGVMTNCVFQ